jgi:hypothetical protein
MTDLEKVREVAEAKDTDPVPMDWPYGTIKALCKEHLRLLEDLETLREANDLVSGR